MGVTQRLYYEDSYLTEFAAQVMETDGVRAYLDRTAFYPTSGGQPFDTGVIGGVRVVEVAEEGGRIAHILERPVGTGRVECAVDWDRRFDHMQQHTGQHLLSAVFEAHAGLKTLSFHLGATASTIDLDAPAVAPETLERIERLANAEAARNREVTVSFEAAESAEGLRKATERQGTIRIVTIDGIDRSACGGTHVRRTGEIGAILLRRTEKIRSSTRVEFVCGQRAVAAARADSQAWKRQAADYQRRIGDLEKERRKILGELAGLRGRERYRQTPPADGGLRRALVRLAEIDETTRAEAQAFSREGPGVFVAVAGSSVLLAVSEGLAVDAGKTLRRFAERGGGSASLAQGVVSDLAALLAELGFGGA
jgi:alanyl-tRNA synthetase